MTQRKNWLYGTSGRAGDEEASELFERFVAAGPESLSQLETLTELPSDLNLATLDRQVEIAVQRWADHDPAASLPVWFGELETRLELGSTGAAIWDGLIHRVALILNHHAESSWILFKDDRPLAAGHNQPALSCGGAKPWSLVRKAIIGLRTDRTTSDWLREQVATSLGTLAASGPPGEENFEVFVHESLGVDWSHTGSLPEETASLLGDKGVEVLWQDLENTPGVVAMSMADYPESFLIRAPGVEAATLQSEFQSLFERHLAAADE